MNSINRKLHKIAAIVQGGGRSFETTVVDNIRIRWPIEHSRNYWFGNHPDSRLIKFLIDQFPERGVFYDIGANVGLYSIALAHALGSRFTGIAFEPCPSTVECLKKNLALNGIRTVETNQMGLSSCVRTLRLSNYPGGLNNFPVSKIQSDHPTIQVPCTTLDDYCSSRNIIPNLLKIDVEGHELHVLNGGRNVLRRHHPAALIEVHGASLTGAARHDILSCMKKWGYDIRDIDGNCVGTLPDRTCHILCTPQNLRTKSVSGP